jgi:hypothetical protein
MLIFLLWLLIRLLHHCRRSSGVADVIIVEHNDEDRISDLRGLGEFVESRKKLDSRFVCSDFVVHAGRDAKLGQDYEGIVVEVTLLFVQFLSSMTNKMSFSRFL